MLMIKRLADGHHISQSTAPQPTREVVARAFPNIEAASTYLDLHRRQMVGFFNEVCSFQVFLFAQRP